jgi:dTDP-4-dehydrorhamnose reductase
MAFNTITILGGKGMLGCDLADAAAAAGFGVRVFDLPEVDIASQAQIKDIAASSEIIVNCAAYTNVEKAETQSELADCINGYAVGRLGALAHSNKVPVIHLSTDFVFDGLKDGPYTESDVPHPLSAYGRSKRLGEQLLEQSGCDSCIIRLQWTYGRHGVNFITKILAAADRQPVLNVVDDQVGSPTCTQEVAAVICRMLRLNPFPRGLYHLAASGYASRYEMARTLFERLGRKVEIVPCKTSDFKTAAVRPLNSRFDCTKLETLLGRPMKTWQAMLQEYLESL